MATNVNRGVLHSHSLSVVIVNVPLHENEFSQTPPLDPAFYDDMPALEPIAFFGFAPGINANSLKLAPTNEVPDQGDDSFALAGLPPAPPSCRHSHDMCGEADNDRTNKIVRAPSGKSIEVQKHSHYIHRGLNLLALNFDEYCSLIFVAQNSVLTTKLDPAIYYDRAETEQGLDRLAAAAAVIDDGLPGHASALAEPIVYTMCGTFDRSSLFNIPHVTMTPNDVTMNLRQKVSKL